MESVWNHISPLLPTISNSASYELGMTCTYLMCGTSFNILARYAFTAQLFSFGLESSVLVDFTAFLSGIFGHVLILHYAGNGRGYSERDSKEQLIRLAILDGIYLVLGFTYAALFAINIGVRGSATLICLLCLLKTIKERFPSVNSRMMLLIRIPVNIIHAAVCIAAVFSIVFDIVQFLMPGFAARLITELPEALGEFNYSRSLSVGMSFALSYHCGCAALAAALSGFALVCEKRAHFPNYWAAVERNFQEMNAPPRYEDLGAENPAVPEGPPPYA